MWMDAGAGESTADAAGLGFTPVLAGALSDREREVSLSEPALTYFTSGDTSEPEVASGIDDCNEDAASESSLPMFFA